VLPALASFARPDRFADDVENAKRNMVIDLMNFGRTEGEAARELEQLIRRPVPIPIEFGPASTPAELSPSMQLALIYTG
jgi:hypothetical protein